MHHFLPHDPIGSHLVTRTDPRVKLLGALALLVMVLTSRSLCFPLTVCVLSLGLCLSLGVRPRQLLFRFAEPAFIAVTILLLKTFFAGGIPLYGWHLAGLNLVAHRDGLLEGVHLAARILGGVSLLGVVGFSTPFTELMAAFSWLKVPQPLVEVALFAWRYLFLLMEDAQVVYNAQRNRLGYVGCRRGLNSLGTLAGVLVIKAFDNSQNVTTAMVQRGYDGALPMLKHQPFKTGEVLAALLVVALFGAVRAL